ncbi:MAG: hypothetical protein ACRBCS_02145 [Cellvibrionaceae bacterium]
MIDLLTDLHKQLKSMSDTAHWCSAKLSVVSMPLFVLLLGLPNMGSAALQGEADALKSTAVTTIQLNIQPNIQISNVSDIELEVADRSQDVVFEEGICVRGNTSSRYNVTAAGQDGNSQPFSLATPNGDTVNYEIYFRGDLTQSNKDPLRPGEASPFYPMPVGATDCDGDNTAAFTVIFRSSDLLPAEPGVYSGFLTLTVAAE